MLYIWMLSVKAKLVGFVVPKCTDGLVVEAIKGKLFPGASTSSIFAIALNYPVPVHLGQLQTLS